jgi:glycoside/pentoside/hexuronide:cation symporter, GPH family
LSQPPPTKKLSLAQKLAYGAGDFGPAVNANILTFFQLLFFTNVAGMPAALAGSVLMVGKIWDAVNDPLIGILSDKTESPHWGRRLPWMLYGAIPFGLFFFLLWIVPPFGAGASAGAGAGAGETAGQWGLFAYYVLIGVLSQVFYTVVNLPYTALTPELTQDYNERTTLNSFRFAFSIGGSIISLILAQVIFKLQMARQQQYLVLAAICAVLSVLTLYWCVYGVRSRVLAFEATRPKREPQSWGAILQELKATMALQFQIFSGSGSPGQFIRTLQRVFAEYSAFLSVIGIYLCSWLALQLTASIMPYFVINRMRIPESDVPLVLVGVQGTALVMLFFWSAMSQRYGKKAIYFMGMGLWLIAQVGLWFLEPGQLGWMYVLAIMAGMGVSTAYLVPWSMMPDVVDLDELTTGERREGFFYGFMVLLQKLGLALGIFLVGIALQASGFKEAVAGQSILPNQPESAVWAIRMVVAPLPAVFLLAGIVLTYFYPIDQAKHAEILLKLSERHRNQENNGN